MSDNDTATNSNPDALSSKDFLTGGTYRDGQEVAVNVTRERIVNVDITPITGRSSWNSDTSASRVNVMIDLTGTELLPGDEIALQWGYTCANDVTEGAYLVPEPGILALLSMGLFSAIGASTFRKQQINR